MASYTGNPYPPELRSCTDHPPETLESDVDDEVDQLDSDSELDETGNDNGAKKHDLPGQRIPGQTLLPAARLENIIQAEGVTGSLALSKEGLFVLSAATEEFIKRMVAAGHLKATSERRTTVSYTDMAAATQQYQEFMFLSDTIPSPINLSDALAMRADRALFEDDPTMSVLATPSYKISNRTSSRAPNQNRNWVMINGQPRKNGSSSSSKRERKSERDDKNYGEHAPPPVDGNRMWAEGSTSRVATNYHPSVPNGRSSTQIPQPRSSSFANGQGHSPSTSRSGTITPARDEPAENSASRPLPQARSMPLPAPEEPWANQYVGPNPGRTIYSQQHRAES